MSRILVVEDEEHIAEGLAFNLRNSGYDVQIVGTGEDALAVKFDLYDLMLLDVMLPGIDGHEVARRLRKRGLRQPILILTAKNRAPETVAGLDAGADDYITKPFDLNELLARLRGLLRRQVWSRSPEEESAPGTLVYGQWEVDFVRFVATRQDGQEARLTMKELAMLRLFASRPGEVISRETFLEEVWGITGALETRTVDNFVRKLRQLFESDPSEPVHLLSVRGEGYRFLP